MNLRKTAAIAALALLGAAGGYWTSRLWQPDRSAAPVPAPEVTLLGLDGKPHSLGQWRGKLLLVNFWATWCAPCMEELPLLLEAQKKYGAAGLQIVGPAMDDADAVKEMVARRGIGYPVMADYAGADRAMTALGNHEGALPYSVFIDAQGQIVQTVLGGLHREELDRLIREHLPR